MFKCLNAVNNCSALHYSQHWLSITTEPGHCNTRTFNLSQFIIYSPSHARAVLKKTKQLCEILHDKLNFTHIKTVQGKLGSKTV